MFHNLCDFIKEELKELDHKVSSGGRLSPQELEYADLLAHMKKSLLTVDAMENPEDYGYHDAGEVRGDYTRGGSYGAGRGRTAMRDSRGRYASSSRMMYRDDDNMKDELYELMDKAPNEKVRRKLEELVSEIDK